MENLNNNPLVEYKYIVKKTHFDINEGLEGDFELAPKAQVTFYKRSELSYETEMKIYIGSSENNSFPFELEVIASVISTFSTNPANVLDLILFLKQNTVSSLYPYIRSIVTNITTAMLVQPIVLPIIDVRLLSEKAKFINF